MHVVIEDRDGGRVTINDGTVTTGQGVLYEHAAKSAAPQWDGTSIATTLIKAAPDRRYSLHVAYPAYKADQCVAADGYRDFASGDAIEEAAWSYLTKSPKVGLWHRDGTDGAGDVVESYIYRGDNWTIKAVDGSEQVIHPGDWLIGIRWNEETWPLVVKGHIRGVSMQGKASRRKPAPETLARLRS